MIKPTPPAVVDVLHAIAHLRELLATLELTAHERDTLSDAATALYEVARRYHTHHQEHHA